MSRVPNVSLAQGVYADLCEHLGAQQQHPAMVEALERARVVGVLDAWAADNDEHVITQGPCYDVTRPRLYFCSLRLAGETTSLLSVSGPTADAARAAAAKAIEAGEV